MIVDIKIIPFSILAGVPFHGQVVHHRVLQCVVEVTRRYIVLNFCRYSNQLGCIAVVFIELHCLYRYRYLPRLMLILRGFHQIQY